MRACARVALVLMALAATLGLAGCAAIDELKDTILRWFESENSRADVARLPTICQTRPLCSTGKACEEGGSKTSRKQDKSARKLQRRRALCFLQRNHRSPIPPRRQGRTKLRGNPRRPLRCDCGLPFPKRRRREFFHAEIGHRKMFVSPVTTFSE